jgi:hypothetical protein
MVFSGVDFRIDAGPERSYTLILFLQAAGQNILQPVNLTLSAIIVPDTVWSNTKEFL